MSRSLKTTLATFPYMRHEVYYGKTMRGLQKMLTKNWISFNSNVLISQENNIRSPWIKKKPRNLFSIFFVSLRIVSKYSVLWLGSLSCTVEPIRWWVRKIPTFLDLPVRVIYILVTMNTSVNLPVFSPSHNALFIVFPVVNPENNQLMENGVKRQDLDHVFLRFGKRRR